MTERPNAACRRTFPHPPHLWLNMRQSARCPGIEQVTERPNAADVLARSLYISSQGWSDWPRLDEIRHDLEHAALREVRAAVDAGPDDIVCLLPDGTLTVAQWDRVEFDYDQKAGAPTKSILYHIPGAEA